MFGNPQVEIKILSFWRKNTALANSKPFDKELHAECDAPAREVVKEFYARIGINLIDNPNQYGVDLICLDKTICVEVERRLVWDTASFPFKTINFLHRKLKFIQDPTYRICEYAIVSKDLKNLGIIDRPTALKVINEKEAKEMPNRFVNEGELFYSIPKDKFSWFAV